MGDVLETRRLPCGALLTIGDGFTSLKVEARQIDWRPGVSVGEGPAESFLKVETRSLTLRPQAIQGPPTEAQLALGTHPCRRSALIDTPLKGDLR